MSDRMSKMEVTRLGSLEVSSPVATQRFLDLKKEVVECRVCPRLVEYRESMARVKKKQFLNWNYWGRPVPGFGDIAATIVVIGLAPAPHGGNLNVRAFTWAGSAELLRNASLTACYATLPYSGGVNAGLAVYGVDMTA